MRLLLPLLLLAGCGDSLDSLGPDELRSGTRLELRYWQFADGTRQWDPTTFFDKKLGLDCMPVQRSFGPTYCQPVSGGPFEDDELVRVFRHTPIGDGRIQVSMLTSDDGMQAPGRLHDSLTGGDCEPVHQDGVVTCRPTRFEQAAYFRDNGCSERLFAHRGFDELPAAVVVEAPGGCDTFFTVGREVSKYPLYYVDSVGACVEIELPDSELVYELGERIEPPLMVAEIMEGARLRGVELADKTLHVPAPWLFDTQLGTTCTTRKIEEQALCLPPASSDELVYYLTEPTCTYFVMGVPVRGCTAPAHYEYPYNGNPKPTIRELVVPTGELFQSVGGVCQPVSANVRVLGRKVELVPGVRE